MPGFKGFVQHWIVLCINEQARVDLPDTVLEKVYHLNAERILGDFKELGGRSGGRR
jgi:hypothetical protein